MWNLATLGKPGELAYKDLIDLVQNHHSHSSKPSVIVQHFKYHSSFRKHGDSISVTSVTKTNSLYVQTYLATTLFLILIISVVEQVYNHPLI